MLDTASGMDPPQGTAEHLTQDGGKVKKIVAREWRRKQKEREASIKVREQRKKRRSCSTAEQRFSYSPQKPRAGACPDRELSGYS